jgi:hypothetical protein
MVKDKHPLPDGWRYEEGAKKWLLAYSPDGKIWFGGGKILRGAKFADEEDVARAGFKLGQLFATEEYMEIP